MSIITCLIPDIPNLTDFLNKTSVNVKILIKIGPCGPELIWYL